MNPTDAVMEAEQHRYVSTKRFGVIKLHRARVEHRGKSIEAWVDETETIWAFAELSASKDVQTRCGMGLLSIPIKTPLDDACRIHDYQTSSPVYQLFHSVDEATSDFYRNTHILAKETAWQGFWSAIGKAMTSLIRVTPARVYWEV